MPSSPLRPWFDLWSAGADMAQYWLRVGETAAAAAEVIESRSHSIAAACRDPLTGDYQELGRMVPEKIDAFWQGGAAAWGDLAALQQVALAQWQQLAGLAVSGSLPSPEAAATLAARPALMARHAAAAAGKSLAPTHRRATANARRLRRRKSR